MTDEPLSDDEWALVWGLRDIPIGAARTELVGLLRELVTYVRDPRCAEAQADGVPCRSTSLDCEQCQGVARALATIRGLVAGASRVDVH